MYTTKNISKSACQVTISQNPFQKYINAGIYFVTTGFINK